MPPALPAFGWTENILAMVLNLLLLVPLGLSVGVACWQRTERPLLIASLALATVPLAIELGQMWIPGRNPTFIDWLLNSIGGIAAAWVALRMVGRGVAPRLLILGSTAAMAIVVATLAFGSAVRLPGELTLRDWDPAFEIESGDEVGGGRPYIGTVTDASICSGAGSATTCARPGADEETRRQLTEHAIQSQRVTIHAEVVSEGRQTGPARIATFSGGTRERNVTLGQEGDDLILRIRSRLHGPNGSIYAYRLADAVPHGEPVRVMARFQLGSVELLAKTPHSVRSSRYRFSLPTVGLTLLKAPALTPTLLDRAAVFGALVLFLPLGFAARILRAQPIVAAGIAATAGLALIVISGLLPAIHILPQDLLLAALCSAVGALIGTRERRPYEP
jgi:hypothetical protein